MRRLRLLLTTIVVAVLATGGLLVAAPTDHADAGGGCRRSAGGVSGNCHFWRPVVVTGTGGGGEYVPECYYGDYIEVQCIGPDGLWVNEHDCYMAAADPQPPLSDPVWKGRTDGKVYTCVDKNGTDRPIWLLNEPKWPDYKAQGSLEVTTSNVPIATAPNWENGHTGVVGLPVWLWAKHVKEWQERLGPQDKQSTVAGETGTISARVTHVTVDWGNGEQSTCYPWDDGGVRRLGEQFDPKTIDVDDRSTWGPKGPHACTHTFTEPGEYRIVAINHWQITGQQWDGTPIDTTMDTYASKLIPFGESLAVVTD